MAIAHDASSPSAAFAIGDDGGGNIGPNSSASFSPPANSWIFVALNTNDGNSGGANPTISNSGTALTWTQVTFRDDGNNTIFLWRAFNANAQTGITVTIAGTDSNFSFALTIGACFVDVWTGAASSQTGAAFNGTSTTTATSNPSVTTTATGSQVSSTGVGGATTYTSSDTILTSAANGSARVYKASNSGAPGAVSCNYVTTGTNPNNFIVYEILAPSGAQNPFEVEPGSAPQRVQWQPADTSHSTTNFPAAVPLMGQAWT